MRESLLQLIKDANVLQTYRVTEIILGFGGMPIKKREGGGVTSLYFIFHVVVFKDELKKKTEN